MDQVLQGFPAPDIRTFIKSQGVSGPRAPAASWVDSPLAWFSRSKLAVLSLRALAMGTDTSGEGASKEAPAALTPAPAALAGTTSRSESVRSFRIGFTVS